MALIKEGSIAIPQTANLTATVNNTDNRDLKTKQIQAQGIIQAAVQAPVLQMFVTNYEEWWYLVEKTAENMLKFVEIKTK